MYQPRSLPAEITDMVLDAVLVAKPSALLNSALVCRSWHPRARKNYFHALAVIPREAIGGYQECSVFNTVHWNPFSWEALLVILKEIPDPRSSSNHPFDLVRHLQFGPLLPSHGVAIITPKIVRRILPYVPNLSSLSFKDIPCRMTQPPSLTITADDTDNQVQVREAISRPDIDLLVFDSVMFQDHVYHPPQHPFDPAIHILLLFSSIGDVRIRKPTPFAYHLPTLVPPGVEPPIADRVNWMNRYQRDHTDGVNDDDDSGAFPEVSSVTFGELMLMASLYFYQCLRVLPSQSLNTLTIRLASGSEYEMRVVGYFLRDLSALEELHLDCEIFRNAVADNPINETVWLPLKLVTLPSLHTLHIQIPFPPPYTQPENFLSIASSLFSSLRPTASLSSTIHTLKVSLDITFDSSPPTSHNNDTTPAPANGEATKLVESLASLSWTSIFQTCDRLPRLETFTIGVVTEDSEGPIEGWTEERKRAVLGTLRDTAVPVGEDGGNGGKMKIMIEDVEGMWS